MNQQNKKSCLATAWQQVAGELRLHREDFWQLALIPFGATVFIGVILAFVLFWVEEPDAPNFFGVVLSVVPVGVATGSGLLTAGSLFIVYYRLGLQMGQTRRAMLLRLGVLSLVEQVFLLAFSAGLGGLIALVFSRYFAEGDYLLALVPWWGWVLMLTLPLAIGSVGGAIILRFGRKGFWVLYAIFMSVILLPQFFTGLLEYTYLDRLIEGTVQLVLEMPHLVCLASLLPCLITVAILWRVPMKD